MDKTPLEMVRDLMNQSTYVSLSTTMSPALANDIDAAGVYLTDLPLENIDQAKRDEVGTNFRQDLQNSGWPYSSMAAVFSIGFVPFMLISELSEHTKNILVNSKVSMMMNDESFEGGNKALMARVTLMG